MVTSSNIIVGMSGGVDSAVTALLLKNQGHAVSGLFMKNWEEDDTDEYCSAEQDLEDARSVCDKIGIELHTVNFSAEYWERVFSRFLAEYEAGRTPNPDVICNQEIKFKAFLEHATRLGAETIATGHYAQTRSNEQSHQLIKGKDADKDQSYFLYRLNQQQLARSLFPLGELDKRDVRKQAIAADLVVHDKPDSTGICFIGERPFKAFLENYLPARPGEICTPEGKKIGDHDGLMYYTIGQRQGLGIGGHVDGSGAPWYVVDKDMDSQTLIAVQGSDHPLLYRQSLTLSDIHWIDDKQPPLPVQCMAKTRYRQADQACTVSAAGQQALSVDFDQPQRAVTPGQSVVFYAGDICLGGGIIDTFPSN